MAAQTREVTINKTGWTLIASGTAFVAVQLANAGRVRIHMADLASPPDDSSKVGINIARNFPGVESGFSAGGLPDETGVWARSLSDTEETLFVLTY